MNVEGKTNTMMNAKGKTKDHEKSNEDLKEF